MQTHFLNETTVRTSVNYGINNKERLKKNDYKNSKKRTIIKTVKKE